MGELNETSGIDENNLSLRTCSSYTRCENFKKFILNNLLIWDPRVINSHGTTIRYKTFRGKKILPLRAEKHYKYF